jgi:uncharacterized protein YkwD
MKKLIAITFFIISYTNSFSQDDTYMQFDHSTEEKFKKAEKERRKKDSTFLTTLTYFDIETFRKEVLIELNRIRKTNGLRPVFLTSDMTKINSLDKFIYNSHHVWKNDWAHDSLRGPCTEVTHYGGYFVEDYNKNKDNFYQYLAKSALESLMSSPPHKRILLNPGKKEIAVGEANKMHGPIYIARTSKVMIRLW